MSWKKTAWTHVRGAAAVALAEARISPGADRDAIAALFTTAASVNDTAFPFLEVPRDAAMPATIASIASSQRARWASIERVASCAKIGASWRRSWAVAWRR